MSYVSTLNEDISRQIYKIVITGGPCAGKTTAISRIHDEFTAKGYNVILVSETATDLIMGGIAPWSMISPDTFQSELLTLQLEKEKLYCHASQKLKSPGKVLIVFDRGAMDGKAYTTKASVFEGMLLSHGLTEKSAKARYDAVFHLVTAAKGAEDFYTTTNNAARTETPKEACELDNRIISAWDGHPNFCIIGNETDFEVKLGNLLRAISEFLGEAEPLETERDFLIKMPDIAALENNPL